MSEELKQKYGFFTVLTLFMGTMIGVGIFLRANNLALASGGDTLAVITAWIVTACIILPTVLIILEIATLSSKAGGIQGYMEDLWGKRMGFTVGISQSFFYLPAIFVLVNLLIAVFTIKVFNIEIHSGIIIIIASISALCLLLINLFAATFAGKIQIISTAIKLLPIVLIIIFGFLYSGDPLNAVGTDVKKAADFISNSHNSFITKVATMLVITFFSLEGWIIVCVLSKEVKNVKKTLPLAMIIGLSLTILIYILFSSAMFQVATQESLATDGSSATNVASVLFGNKFGSIINIFVLISALGVGNSVAMAFLRAPYSVAKSRSFPGSKWLEKINPKLEMPLNSAIIAIMIIAAYMLLIIIAGHLDTPLDFFEPVADSTILLFLCYYMLTCIGVVKLRIQKPNLERPFKTPMIWIFVILAVLGCMFALYGLGSLYVNKLNIVIITILCSLCGLVLFSLTKEKQEN